MNIEKVKNVVKNNFKISVEKYFAFENKYNFFYNLAESLGKFANVVQEDYVLDVGCGYGVSCKALAEKFKCNVTGVDLSDEMINFGKRIYPDIELCIGDGEKLSKHFSDEHFDKILYNASVFIFPDTFTAFQNAFDILKKNGVIAFSHYPQLLDENKADLFDFAYEKAKLEKPKSRVLSTIETCIENLRKAGFVNIETDNYTLELDTEFLKNFFLIPAQSASLIHKKSYEERIPLIEKLFDILKHTKGIMSWALVKGKKDGSCQK